MNNTSNDKNGTNNKNMIIKNNSSNNKIVMDKSLLPITTDNEYCNSTDDHLTIKDSKVVYNDDLKVKAIQYIKQGMSYKRTAQILQVGSPNTIRTWFLNSSRYIQNDSAMSVREGMRDQYTVASATLLNEALEQSKLDKASTKDLIVASKIVLDASQMIEEDIYAENEYTEQVLAEREKDLEEITDEMDITRLRLEEIQRKKDGNTTVNDDMDDIP